MTQETRWRRAEQRVARAWRHLGLDLIGLFFAAVFFAFSLTPSLLPRDWLFQGLVSGISMAVGYGLGLLVKWAGQRWVLPRRSLPDLSEAWMIRIRLGALVAFVGWQIFMLLNAVRWQNALQDLMGMPRTTALGYIPTAALSLVVFAGLFWVARLVREAAAWVSRVMIRRLRLSRRAARLVSVLLVATVALGLVNGLLPRLFFEAANRTFSLQNSEDRAGVTQPLLPERSGSPDSLAAWDSLGLQGRAFVSRGLRAAELEEVTGEPAHEPIRVYAGLETADDDEGRMDAIIDELERTGAFDREVLVLVPATGTGWVNPTAAQAIELMYNGDTAVVAMQYSYLPSWISFLADREKAESSGRTMVNRAYERLAREPEGSRPDLYVYGESLGTQAGEGAFSGLRDIRATVDGVLWVGPPNANTLWSQLVDRRDPGTREVAPEYSGGMMVRFAQGKDDLHSHEGAWLEPRVLYIQHASDPVVWWSPDLILSRPDWLEEPPGRDRLPAMRWMPFITFSQVTFDLTNAGSVPDGHGHNYGTLVLDGWVSVAAPDGWTDADTERLRPILEEAIREQDSDRRNVTS